MYGRQINLLGLLVEVGCHCGLAPTNRVLHTYYGFIFLTYLGFLHLDGNLIFMCNTFGFCAMFSVILFFHVIPDVV